MSLVDVEARRAYARQWRAKNAEKVRVYALRCIYGIEPEEWKLLCVDGCGICGSHIRLVPDHDHETNIVRGALCKKCNTALGQFNDDPTLLKKALMWLERGRCR